LDFIEIDLCSKIFSLTVKSKFITVNIKLHITNKLTKGGFLIQLGGNLYIYIYIYIERERERERERFIVIVL